MIAHDQGIEGGIQHIQHWKMILGNHDILSLLTYRTGIHFIR